jgi:hypothetical protein
MTRQAISPRFAIRIRLNMCWLGLLFEGLIVSGLIVSGSIVSGLGQDPHPQCDTRERG